MKLNRNRRVHIVSKCATVSAVQRGPYVEAHQARHVTHWTLLRHLDIALFMLVTVLSAAAVTFCDSVLAPFLQVDLFFGISAVHTVGQKVDLGRHIKILAAMIWFSRWLASSIIGKSS